jgi:hypothetical protein
MRDMLDEGCLCPNGHPPCEFCVSLTEEELDVYQRYGAAGVRRLREEKEEWQYIQAIIGTADLSRPLGEFGEALLRDIGE